MRDLPILYVEDEENDALFVRLAFQKANLPNPLRVAVDGKEALDYLAGNGAFANREESPLPALVLLDLNMPGLSGFDVLQWIREQPQFQSLPVVIFSASAQASDRRKAQQMGANDYLAKPSDMTKLPDVLKTVVTRWLVR